MTDRENEGREMLSCQRCLPSPPLNQGRECLALDPICAFQITFSLQRDTLLQLIGIVFSPQYPS